MKLYHVQLTEEQRHELQQLVSTGVAAARLLTHARILLLADAGRQDKEIVAALGSSLSTVQRARQRFVSAGMNTALHDQPRSGRPIRLSGEVEAQLVVLACSQPPPGQARWTLTLLAERLVELGVTEHISDTSVHSMLKKTNLSLGGSKAGASPRLMPAS